MNDIELQAERKAFEAWYEAYCMPSEADWFRRDVDDESEYHHAITADAWAAWLARAAVEADRAQRVPDGYDQGSAECMAAVQQILDGKDRGDGVANEPWESIRRRLIALVAPAPAQQDPSEAEMVCAEAYQVVGCLLSDLGLFETEAARKILDNLSEARMVHQDVLPWEPAAQHQEPPQQERNRLTGEQASAMAAYFNVPADYVHTVYNRVHGIKE